MKTLSITFWYGLLCLGFVVILVLELSFVNSQVGSVSQEATIIQTNIETLKGRLSALQSVRPTVTDAVLKSSNAIPSDNSSLIVVSQVRYLAINRSIELRNMTLNALPLQEGSDLGKLQIDFTATGSTDSLVSFFDDLLGSAPILSFDSVSLIANGDSSIAQISLNSFWSSFPTKLPSLTDPIQALNESEQNLLSLISGLREPALSTATSSGTQSEVGKADPFSSVQ